MNIAERISVACSAVYRILFNKQYFFSNNTHFYHANLKVSDAQSLIKVLDNAIEQTVTPIRLLDEANEIINSNQ